MKPSCRYEQHMQCQRHLVALIFACRRVTCFLCEQRNVMVSVNRKMEELVVVSCHPRQLANATPDVSYQLHELH